MKNKEPELITGEEKLKELIKSLIRKELDEMTGTGAVGPVTGKFFLSKNPKGSVKGVKTLKKMGWTTANETMDSDEDDETENPKFKKHLTVVRKLEEAVSRYKRFKEYPMKNRSKISLAVQEINKMLREVDFLTSINEKLKTELNVPEESLWKRTAARISEIRSRLKSIEAKLKNIHK